MGYSMEIGEWAGGRWLGIGLRVSDRTYNTLFHENLHSSVEPVLSQTLNPGDCARGPIMFLARKPALRELQG